MSKDNAHRTPPPGLWAGQVLHFALLAILLLLLWLWWAAIGQPWPTIFWVSAAVPVAHQVFVWLAWRFELNDKSVSQTVGFTAYIVAFFVLFGGRFVVLMVLAWFDLGSLGLSPAMQAGLTIICLLPGLYAMYSVHRYFGMVRAAGADHFEARYRTMPLVKQGIFKFTNNGMYVFAFMLFWAIAFGFNSSAALAVVVFSHAYIWVHHFATEKVDMDYLYGE